MEAQRVVQFENAKQLAERNGYSYLEVSALEDTSIEDALKTLTYSKFS